MRSERPSVKRGVGLSSLLLRRGRSESDLKAQSFELAHEALFFLVSIEFVEVGAAEFLILLLVGQHSR